MRPQQPGRRVPRDERVDVVQRGHPVAQIGDGGPALGDRQAALGALAPVVDDVGNHVHGPGQYVRLGHEPDVFPHHLLGEGQLAGIPEAAPEQLVPHRHVVQQPRRPADMRPGLPALDGQRMQRRGVDPFRPDAQHGTAGEIRSGALQRVQQQLIRVGGQHVIAVDEGEELPAGALDAAVARASRSAVSRLHQREPRICRRLRPGDLGPVIGRPVIDHDHFQVGERLGGDRVQAVGEIVSVVEERHYDANPRRAHWCPLGRHPAAGVSQPSATGS